MKSNDHLKRAIGRAARACFAGRRGPLPSAPSYAPPASMQAAEGACARLPEPPRRLIVCCFWDAAGAADDCAPPFLRALKPCAARVVAACCAAPPQALRDAADAVLLCTDAASYPALATAALRQLAPALSDYDELALLDGTLYGPLYAPAAVFAEMAARPCDFWGLCCRAEAGEAPYLEPCWLAVRGRLLQSAALRQFFAAPPTEEDAFARAFTVCFSGLGYEGQSWLPAEGTAGMSDDPMLDLALTLARDRRCPVLARRAFTADYDRLTSVPGQHTAAFLMDYLEGGHPALAELIWSSLLRAAPMAALVRNLALGEIIDAAGADDLPLPDLRAAVIAPDAAALSGLELPPELPIVPSASDAAGAELFCLPAGAPREVLPSRAFIARVLWAFARRPRLGVLYAPSGGSWTRAGLTRENAAARGYYAAPLLTVEAAAAEVVRLQTAVRADAHACFQAGIGGRYPLMRDALARRAGESGLVSRLRRVLNRWAEME